MLLRLNINCKTIKNLSNDLNFKPVDINVHTHLFEYYWHSPVFAGPLNVVSGNRHINFKDIIQNTSNEEQFQVIYFIDTNTQQEIPVGLFRTLNNEIDNESVFLVYMILPQFQGQGIGSQIPIMIEKHLKNQKRNIKKIYASAFKSNIASQKILIKNQYKEFLLSVNASKIDINNSTIQNMMNVLNNDISTHDMMFFYKDLEI